MDPLAAKTAIAIAPVLACLAVFLAVDVFKLTPPHEILELLTAGAVICIACYFAAGRVIDQFPMQRTTYSQEIAPVLEESLKALAVIALFGLNRIGYTIDAAITGFAIGAGFALAENIFYLNQFTDADMGVWVVRGFGTAIMHGGATAILAVVSYVLYAPRLRLSADRFQFDILLFAPGLAGAIGLHWVFNQFTGAPLIAMMIVLAGAPLAILAVFAVGERYAHRWLTAGHGAHARLLEEIDSGAFAATEPGRAIGRLAERLGDDLGPAVFDYVRTHTELVVRAEDRLLALEDHAKASREAGLRDRFRHLRELEQRLGRPVVLAARQHLRFSRNDLWEMHELETTGQ